MSYLMRNDFWQHLISDHLTRALRDPAPTSGVRNSMPKRVLALSACMLFMSGCGDEASERIAKSADGIVVTPESGVAKRVRLQVISDRIIRVTAAPTENLDVPQSLMVTATPAATATFRVESTDEIAKLSTSQITAEVALASGRVTFKDAQGKAILQESQSAFQPVKVDDKDFYAIQQQFNPGTDEAFYGLGQHQNAQMNYNG
ncbi:MAG TPA: hypothetical protein VNA21_14955, partial [Steroidobacteraceae bacterium]|nr:hypothetical protein [Steroidobacteraceae bacterium]